MTGHIRNKTTKTGTTYQVVLEDGADAQGKRQKKHKSFKTKKEAQAFLNKTLAEYNQGSYIEPSKLTVADVVLEWLTTYAMPRLAPTTIAGYKVNLEKHTLPYIGHILVQQLTPLQVQNLYSLLNEKALSARTIHYIHTTLREVLEYARKRRYTSENAADFVSTPKQKKYKASVYDESEAAALLNCAKGTDMEISLNIALETGLRRGELLSLMWQDINWEKRTLNVCRNLVCLKGNFEFGNPKTQSGNRLLLLSAPLLEKLKQHNAEQAKIRLQLGSAYNNHDLICCKPDGTPYNTGSYSHKFQRFLIKNGLRSIRLHDLRHTNATLMLKSGIPAKIASERLGHANITITLDTYSHVSTDMQQGAVDKLVNSMKDKSLIG